MSIQTRARLSGNKLQKFRKKSKILVPRCFGAYDRDDIVCEKWCSRAHHHDIEQEALNQEEKLDEVPAYGFFYRKSNISCEEERGQTEHEINKLTLNLKNREAAKIARNDLLLRK